MAAIQFKDEPKNICITRRTGAPKKATLEAWFKQCRNVIPQIPSTKDGKWVIEESFASTQWIRFDLREVATGARVYIVVDRSAPSI